ncbi:TonB family protein [Roseateles sp. BYS87W]|uniref:TonB family protein n=1 Tax=Pelomonas baiyunensis TaxID=3299026 RepID=A0ABW7H067_9BURK
MLIAHAVKPLHFVAPQPVASAAAPVALRVTERPSYADLATPPGRQRWAVAGILALHILAFWALSQGQAVKRTVARMAPVVVRLMAPAEPPKPQPRPPVALPDMKAPTPPLIEPPVIAVATAPAPALVVAALPAPPPVPAQVQPAPAPVAQVVPPPAPVATPALKRIPASAVRYVREPRSTVPLMSKRLKESGVVHVRVVVDVNGLPREVALAKSSGFARLDEQALQDIRTARFAPQTENGQPIEWEVITPMSYELDR